MFDDRHVKIVLDFEITFFHHCFVTFGVQRGLVDPNQHTHRFLDHSKQIKHEKDMGFETKEGPKVFFQNI